MSDNKLIGDKKYVLPFGKFKGQSIEDLMKNGESEYLLWAHSNDEYLPWFELNHILLSEVEDAAVNFKD